MTDAEVRSEMKYWEQMIRRHSMLLREALDEYTAWRARLEGKDDKGNSH